MRPDRIMISMPTYLLPCRCSAEIPVSKGQAGGQVTCPTCGAVVAVPKLRDFAGLREQVATVTSGTVWTAAHAWLLTGLVAAALGWSAAGLARSGIANTFSPDAIRAAVAAANDVDVYKAWKQELSQAGVWRPPSAAEEKLLRAWQFSSGVARILQFVGTLGALAAAAAAVAIGFGRPGSRSPEHPPVRGEASR